MYKHTCLHIQPSKNYLHRMSFVQDMMNYTSKNNRRTKMVQTDENRCTEKKENFGLNSKVMTFSDSNYPLYMVKSVM